MLRGGTLDDLVDQTDELDGARRVGLVAEVRAQHLGGLSPLRAGLHLAVGELDAVGTLLLGPVSRYAGELGLEPIDVAGGFEREDEPRLVQRSVIVLAVEIGEGDDRLEELREVALRNAELVASLIEDDIELERLVEPPEPFRDDPHPLVLRGRVGQGRVGSQGLLAERGNCRDRGRDELAVPVTVAVPVRVEAGERGPHREHARHPGRLGQLLPLVLVQICDLTRQPLHHADGIVAGVQCALELFRPASKLQRQRVRVPKHERIDHFGRSVGKQVVRDAAHMRLGEGTELVLTVGQCRVVRAPLARHPLGQLVRRTRPLLDDSRPPGRDDEDGGVVLVQQIDQELDEALIRAVEILDEDHDRHDVAGNLRHFRRDLLHEVDAA